MIEGLLIYWYDARHYEILPDDQRDVEDAESRSTGQKTHERPQIALVLVV
jgi:hypothetical protein